jgi:hypothetical protein
MPMALGCLLGGPFTGISTPPNILATDALRSVGLTPFEIFDFTPITGALVVAGIAFMVLLGKRLLPRGGASGTRKNGIESAYEIGSHIFTIDLPSTSPLVGRSLGESRLGSALYLTVVGLHRGGELILSPRAQETLQAGDSVIVHGQSDQVSHFHGSRHLRVEQPGPETAEITESPGHGLGPHRLKVRRSLGALWPRAACGGTTACMCWLSIRPQVNACGKFAATVSRKGTVLCSRASTRPWKT